MTREQLLSLHQNTCQAAFDIMEAKNQDYTGGSEDPFANFRATEMLGVPAEIGVLTRCLDKFQRVRSFVANGSLAVKNESVDDAIEDVINYMVLLKGIIRERQGEKAKAKIGEPFQDVDNYYESQETFGETCQDSHTTAADGVQLGFEDMI